MKKLSFILLVATFCMATSMKTADEVTWMGFDEGYKLAKKSGKIMLVDVYTDWCGWCKRMDRDTYAKPEIAALIKDDYIAIKFNPEVNATYTFEGKTYTGSELAGVLSQNKLSGYPTTIFYYPKDKKTNVMGGYFDASRFQGVLTQVKKDFKPGK